MSDIIDINVGETIEEVTINVVDNLITVNINKVTGGGGGTQTLAQTLDYGNVTGGENISISNGDAIILDNGSMLKKGTIDAGNGGSKGISQICGVGFEHKWEAGRLYIMNDGGTIIREVSHNLTYIPTTTDDVTKGFVQNTRWILDNGDVYLCTDPTEDAAVWELVNTGTTPTLQQVLDNNHDLVDGNNFQGTEAGLDNTGTNVIAFGNEAAINNTGDNVNVLGNSAGQYNIANNVNAMGLDAARSNSGEQVNAIGEAAALNNTFNNVNLFGQSATADEDGQTVLSKDGTIMARISTTDLTATRKYNLQDGDGTLAFLSDITGGGVTSVGLTMPSAFSVINSPITSSGDIAVTGAGLVSQYVRGDGTLANFPNSTGGGSSVNYYLNGSVSQGTFGGDTYYEMSKTPILGAGTNFTRTNGAGNGYIASFITNAGDPSFLNIPGGNWNLEFYFQSSATGGSPQFYGEIYKVSATNVFTLVASGSANPEGITNGTTVDQYFTSIPVPQTSLLITDRLAVRIYVITSGRTITLHTENGNLCEVLTTFTTGLTALNGLTQQVQNLAVGTSGTDFAISSATDTHTFNLPTASASNRGALSSTDWSTFNSKQNALGFTAENVANKENTTLDTSTSKYPTNRLVKEYADAKVADSITDGVTTIAPSQNAVFDALDTKQNKLKSFNRQTSSYTLVLSDADKLVEMDVATANNLTIPLNSTVAYAVGTQIDISQYGAGQTTFVATSGVTIRSANNWLKINARYGAATLTKVGTDEWYLWGNLNA
jgi:hypothetical protein